MVFTASLTTLESSIAAVGSESGIGSRRRSIGMMITEAAILAFRPSATCLVIALIT